MVDLSIIEFVVYGFFAYSSALMLILQVLKEAPSEKSHSIVRSIYLIPGIIASFVIASSGINIVSQNITNTILAVNTTEVFTETIATQIVLQNPVWVTFHYLIGIIMIVYVFLQVITLFTKLK